MIDEGYSSDIVEIIFLIIKSHSWLEIIHLFLAIYITIPTKLMNASWGGLGSDFVSAKASKWPNDLFAKIISPFGLALSLIIFLMMPFLYSIFGLVFGLAAEKILQRNNLFDPIQMLFESVLVCAFTFAYCQISLAFKKIGDLQSEIDQLRYEKGLAEAQLSRALESAGK